MDVMFKYGVDVWTIRAPDYDNVDKRNSGVAFGRATSGVLYRYTKGTSLQQFNLKWSRLCEDEMLKVVDLFDSLKGVDFFYTDHKGDTYEVCIISEEIALGEATEDRYDVGFSMEVV